MKTVISIEKSAPVPSESASTSLPIVCDPTLFTLEERTEHLEQTKALLIERPTRRQALDDGLEFHYLATDELFEELAAWAKFEHRCCAWARFTLEMEPFAAGSAGGLRLRISGSPELSALLLDSLDQLAGKGPIIQEFLHAQQPLTLASRPGRRPPGGC